MSELLEDLDVDALKAEIHQLRIDCDKLAEIMNNVFDSGMRKKTLLILLNHYTGVPQKQIKKVMLGLENLEAEYFGEFEE